MLSKVDPLFHFAKWQTYGINKNKKDSILSDKSQFSSNASHIFSPLVVGYVPWWEDLFPLEFCNWKNWDLPLTFFFYKVNLIHAFVST